jgi:tRNA modification GTPase
VALVGEPNVGKSSLLNLLLQSDRAIVTPIAGTTRDVVEGEIVFNGTRFSFSDTAGLRETADQVEIIGIDKSRKEAAKADLLCFVLDCTSGDWKRALQLAEQLENSKKIFLLNKSEKIIGADRERLLSLLPPQCSFLFTSAIDESSRDSVFQALLGALGSLEFMDEAIISSSRQFEQARYSREMISNSIGDLEKNMGAEFVAMHLKESLVSLQKILGQVYDDQIMDRVFKEFCLGK